MPSVIHLDEMAWQSESVVLANGVHPVKNVHFDETQAHPEVFGQSVWLNGSQYYAYVTAGGGEIEDAPHVFFVESQAQLRAPNLVQSAYESNWAHEQFVVEYV